MVDAWLDPSSASPRIVLFADFSRQALYASPAGTREVLRQRLRPANFGLRRNCRNTLKISAETELLTGSFDIRACERQPPGEPVERFFFTDAHDEVRQIGRALQRLRSEGFAPSDIIILGSRRREKTALAGVTSCGGFRIVDREASRSGAEVVYATVHAFKGLESPAVVLMDCQPGTDALGDALLYVGMTRARVRLAMILPEAARDEIAAREQRNLEIQLG
ncbi:MAG: ATP-binding domain-containing protein [Chloroflexi bacterium]|nr:ATP-binding domain-containing protein [Chloroflexota bacterium]